MYNDIQKELSGNERYTTNNRMELMAVIKGLEAIKEPCIVELYSDSRYVIDALRLGWAKKWKSNNWIRSGNTMAANADLWDTLLRLTDIHTVHYHWVKGHASNVYNNRCDELAVQQRLLLK
jgi:ribonuclease HI